MMGKFAALQLQSVIGELFALIADQGWRLTITAWNPKTGSVWEISPIGVKQTKKPNAQRVQITVTESTEEEGTNDGREESNTSD